MNDKSKCNEVTKTYIECESCGTELYQCEECKEYFMKDHIVYCMNDGRHICDTCYEDWCEEIDSELNVKQQLKQEEI